MQTENVHDSLPSTARYIRESPYPPGPLLDRVDRNVRLVDWTLFQIFHFENCSCFLFRIVLFQILPFQNCSLSDFSFA